MFFDNHVGDYSFELRFKIIIPDDFAEVFSLPLRDAISFLIDKTTAGVQTVLPTIITAIMIEVFKVKKVRLFRINHSFLTFLLAIRNHLCYNSFIEM